MPTLILLRKIADRYTAVYTHGMDHLGISILHKNTDVKHIAPGEGFFIYMRGGSLNGAG